MADVRIRHVGWSALLIETDHVATWYAELVRLRASGELSADEIVPAERTVLLDGVPEPDAVARLLAGRVPEPVPAAAGALVELPTVYDGEDLDRVAQLWQVSRDEVIRRHAGTEFRVEFCGFSPGFAYLAGLPDDLAVPRLDTPRPRVPAGSVGLAGRYCGVYPSASPGGWLLLGRTDRRLFDVEADPPALLAPGTRVRFVHA